MAVFKLGALITDLVGSVGGTTFKRQGSSSVMMRKSPGASRGSTQQNKRIANNAVIFKSWNFLSDSDKLAWNANASATKVKNKFGDDVNITGVAFQRKCELAGKVIFVSNIDPTTFTTDLNPYSITLAEINWAESTFRARIEAPSGSCNMCFMLEYTLKNLPSPQFTRRGVFAISLVNGDQVVDLWADLQLNYPFINANYNLRLYTYQVNDSGWASNQQFLEVTKR